MQNEQSPFYSHGAFVGVNGFALEIRYMKATAAPPQAAAKGSDSGVIGFPPSHIIVGNAPEMLKDPLGYILELQRKHPIGVCLKLRGPNYILFRPDDVKHILVTNQKNYVKGRILKTGKTLFGNGLLASEGAFHLHQRHQLQPAFHRQSIASYAQTMVEKTVKRLAKWNDGETLDIAEEMMSLTLEIVAKTLFGIDDVGRTDKLGKAVTIAQTWLFRKDNSAFPLPENFPTPRNIEFKRAMTFLDNTIFGIIDGRIQRKEFPNDLLTMLLLAEDEEGKKMGPQQLRDEALTLFLAGHETTSNALSWTLYLLSQDSKVESKFHAELDSALGGRPPTVSDIPNLQYTDMILSESMRLYPPAWILPRISVGEDHLPSGAVLPKGVEVEVSQWAVHRNPEFFPDPEHFDPERFSPKAKDERPQFSYFPFGGGTRRCIGESFAKMEGVLLLATLAQRYRFELKKGEKVIPEPLITLRPKGGLKMTLHARKL